MSNSIIQRRVIESPFEQGANEQVAYPVVIPPTWGTPVGEYAFVVEDATDSFADVTADKATGGVTYSGTDRVLATPKVKSLIAGCSYVWRMRFRNDVGQLYEIYAQLEVTR